MASEEHIAVIRKGVSAWNRWRQANPAVIPDLSGARIKRRNLGGINLRKADLSRAALPGVKLKGANLEEADLACADLMEADLRNTWMAGANLSCANLFGANLENADLAGAELSGAIIFREDLADRGCADNHIWFETLLNFGFHLCECEQRGAEKIS